MSKNRRPAGPQGGDPPRAARISAISRGGSEVVVHSASSPAPPRPESDDRVDLRSYWDVVRRRWRLVLGTFAVVVVGVAVGTLLQKPVYRATGIVEIRRGAEGSPFSAAGEVPAISEQHLETEYEVLRSPALAQRVIDDLSVPAVDANGDAGAVAAFTPTEQLPPPSTVDHVRSGLMVEPVRGSRLVRIHFDYGDPVVAARTVNSIIRRYTDLRVEAALAAESQLASQVDSVRQQLTASERRLQEHTRGSDLVFVESGAGEENILHERLRHLQQELTEAEADRFSKQALYNLVQQQGVEHLRSDVLSSLSTRIADLRVEYARLRSTFTDDFPRTQQVSNQIEELERLLSSERARIRAQIRNDYASATRRQELLQQTFLEQRALVDRLADQTAEYHVQRREVEAQQALLALLQQKQKEAGVAAALAHTEVSVVNPATVPESPIRPIPASNMKLGVVLGLILGLGLAFVRELTDDTVRTIEEVDAVSSGPVLALIPASDSIREDQRAGAMAEAFAGLRTSILLNGGAPAPRSLLVTSAQPEEGKTTVSTSLACSLAALRHRVLLIDGDLRRPAVGKILRLKRSGGLAEHLADGTGWRKLVQPSLVPGLDALPAGDPPNKPVDLLASSRMSDLIEEAQEEYDFVIVDAPAVFINAADARILAPLMDGVVLVIRSGVTPRDITSRVMKLVPHIMGVVLNGIDFRHFPAYYGDYGARRNGSEPPRLTQGASA